MRRAALTFAVVLAGGAAACASILGIEDGVLDTTDGDGGIQLCTADSGVAVDPSQLFVSAEVGADTPTCGAPSAPCKTIKAALEAVSPAIKTIYLATSRHSEVKYVESVALPPGIELQGGWSVRGSPQAGYDWQPICQDELANPQQIANIIGTDGVTIRVAQGAVALTNLYLGSRPAEPGESLYGVMANGADTVVTLTNVIVNTPHGGDGRDGDGGSPGADAPDASCEAGTGMTPEPGAGGDPAGAPSFQPDGVAVASATPGHPGGAGSNGAPSADAGCVSGASCAAGLGCSDTGLTACGTPGLSGCGGGGGSSGGAGQSAGSAVGIYVSGGARIVVNAGAITVDRGGNGGAGGVGGPGGKGSMGAKGDPSASIHNKCTACLSSPSVSAQGSSGTLGAPGSSGGQGGGGAAGDSFAFINLDASISSDAEVHFGSPGSAGQPGGATGRSGTYGP